MFAERATNQLDVAAEPSLRRIRADRRRVSEKIRPLLEHIEHHLLDPDLDVNSMKRACEVRDNSLQVRFHTEVGDPPGVYIREHRMQTAARLLRDTDLPIATIGDMIGCSSVQVFSRAFLRWAGQRPRDFRKASRKARAVAQPPPLEEDLYAVETWRKACNGKLRPEQAEKLIRYLEDLYSTVPRRRAVGRSNEREEVERSMAEAAWSEIRHRPWEEQRELVREGLRFRSPAFFYLLGRKSREEGRSDRRRGVRIAELSLDSLAALSGEVGERELANLRALAWGWIGNARRLALDLAGAEKAFEETEAQLPREGRERSVVARILHFKACLRWYQRDFGDALELENRALPLLDQDAQPEPLAEALVMRAAIQGFRGELEGAVDDYRRALAILDEEAQPFQTLSASYNLVSAYVDLGRYDEATALLPLVRRLTAAAEGGGFLHHLQWLEAAVAEGRGRDRRAGELYAEAREGFLELGEAQHAAAVGLDLAVVLARHGRATEARDLATETLPVFDALGAQRDALAALGVLREAVAAEEVRVAELERAREELRRLRRGPLTA